MSLHTQGLWGNPQGQGETTAAWSLYSGASEMGPLHTRRGQAEDYAKASWRIRASAWGVGLQERCRGRRISRITSSGRAEQVLQLIPPVCGDLGVGMQGKALRASTAETGKRGCLALVTTSRADTLDGCGP